MYLFEFDQDRSQMAQLVALTNQLKQDVDSGDIDVDNYTVDELLDYFQKYDIILDTEDLYNMIKVPPLKDLISNIQGDKVVLRGHDEEGSSDADPQVEKNKGIVSQMAKSALNK